MSGHDVALLIHLLLFVYWLGGDIGVFYSSGLSVNRSLSREARQMAGKIMINLDLIPRLCLSLMLTVGGVLTEYYGIDHPTWQWFGIILLGPVWFCALVYMHFNEGSDLVKKMTKDQLRQSLEHIEKQCKKHGIPKPTSFCSNMAA